MTDQTAGHPLAHLPVGDRTAEQMLADRDAREADPVYRCPDCGARCFYCGDDE